MRHGILLMFNPIASASSSFSHGRGILYYPNRTADYDVADSEPADTGVPRRMCNDCRTANDFR